MNWLVRSNFFERTEYRNFTSKRLQRIVDKNDDFYRLLFLSIYRISRNEDRVFSIDRITRVCVNVCMCVCARARPNVCMCARARFCTYENASARERGTMCFVLYNKRNVQTVVHITKSALVDAKEILLLNFDRWRCHGSCTNLRNRFPNPTEINRTINTHCSLETFILLVPKHFLRFIA